MKLNRPEGGAGLVAVFWEKRNGEPHPLRFGNWKGLLIFLGITAGWFLLARLSPALLAAVVDNWPVLGKTSVDGLRLAFLQRGGHRPYRLLELQRFRMAYDFLVLRAEQPIDATFSGTVEAGAAVSGIGVPLPACRVALAPARFSPARYSITMYQAPWCSPRS